MKYPTPIFEGDIIDGKLRLLDHVKKAISLWCRTFKTGTHVEIKITKYRSKRTNEQNRYYWGVVIPILADHFGHDNSEDMHEDLKLKFNPIKSKIESQKIIGGTTTNLSTVDFYSSEDSYIERICRWAAMEYSIYIPPPKKGLDKLT